MNPILVLLSGAMLLFGSASSGQEATSQPKLGSVPAIPPEKGYFVQEIRGGPYWVTDGLYNTMFLVSSDGVIAVDPLPNLGRRYLKAIAEVTNKPITHVVYSQEHTDHIGAAYLFPTNAVYIAQKNTAEILGRRNDPRRPVPTAKLDGTYKLTVGDQTLVLDYKGVNHESGNIFIYAPKQRVLMLVDVIYPGWMPYKNLGIAEDVQGYIDAHREALGYDFDTLVAGHVNRLGTRRDVEVSLEFVPDLKTTAQAQLQAVDFPAFIKTHPARHKWDLHNEYERSLVEGCYATLFARWNPRLKDTETYLRDNCWAMIEALVVDLPANENGPR